MRIFIMLIVLSCFFSTAMAGNPESVTLSTPISYDPDRAAFYSQLPSAEYMAHNASSAFGSEIADNIPDGFSGVEFTQITLFLVQWDGTEFVAPDGLTFTVYDEACPPGMEADMVFEIPWSELETELLSSGSTFVYACTATLPEAITITEAMSVGGYVNTPWETDAPFNGLAEAPLQESLDCAAYWDFALGGYDRWTPMVWYGYGVDLAYVLGSPTVASEPASWGTIKSLYR